MYFTFNSVHYDEYLERNCTIECQATQFCSVLTQRYEEFESCQAEQIPLPGSSETFKTSPLYLLSLFLFYSFLEYSLFYI